MPCWIKSLFAVTQVCPEFRNFGEDTSFHSGFDLSVVEDNERDVASQLER
jgi:hypothetical protein